MNFYSFHIGDYLSATRHLSWEEDAAFRRLLDTYYITEKALPADLKAVCRLVVATKKAQCDAVKQVLQEFFELTPDGWINHRADSEICTMRDKQSANEVRDTHEKDRVTRHRERRAEMFAALRVLDVVPAWDIQTKDLQRLHDERCKKPPAEPVTPPVTPVTPPDTLQEPTCNAPDTAIPIPIPIPIPNKNTKNTSAVAQPDGVSNSVWADFCQHRKSKGAKLTQTAMDGIQIEVGKAGWSLENALRECCARGWTGFKADWVNDKLTSSATGQRRSEAPWVTQQRKRMQKAVPEIAEYLTDPRELTTLEFFEAQVTAPPVMTLEAISQRVRGGV